MYSMSLREGAKTIVEQCINVKDGEEVVIVNDGNDMDLLNTLVEVTEENTENVKYIQYGEPETHGSEPPRNVAKALRKSDVFIAPTLKSISHTQARIKACEAGSRGATLPGINREIWNSSLQADYGRVKELSEEVYNLLSDTSEVNIKTPSGTDLRMDVNFEYYQKDTGILHNSGDFGNLPAGEAFGAPVSTNGTLVVDHFPYAPKGSEIKIEDNKAVSIDRETSQLHQRFEEVEGSRNVAEFGFGTNPEATLIGEILQDEKVFGTVHIAFGDNSSMVPEGDSRRVKSDVHLDTICENPTVKFDDKVVMEEGEPVFLE